MANEYQQRYNATSDTASAGGFLFDDDDAGKDIGVSKIVFGADGAAITRVSGGNGTAATALRVTLASDSTGVLAATQSGTWNVTNISGTISLPTGAATAAKQPALGTAGTASSDVITVQGIASMTALKVDGSAVTQPVSGTFWQATQPVSLASTTITGTVASTQSGTWTVQPGNTANTTAWLVTGTGGTFPITDSGGSITVDNGGTFAVQATLQSGTAYAGKVRLTDGTNDVTLLNLTSSKPVPTAIVDGSGNQITSFGGGTQYTEDVAAAANPVGTVPILVRADAPGGISDTDGDNVAQRGTNYGAAYVTILNNAGTSVDFATESTLSTLNGKVTACNTGAVTISAALPAGTNLLGRASGSDETSTIYNGTTALTPKFATIAASSSGNNTLVAAVTSKKIRVLAYNIMGSGAVNAKFQSGASGTDLTGLKYIAAAGGGLVAPYCQTGWFETGSGVLLNLNLSGAVAVGGELVYVEV